MSYNQQIQSASIRDSDRLEIYPDIINGKFEILRSGDSIPFNLIDISTNGVGMWVPLSINIGERISIKFVDGAPTTLGEVVWCADDDNKTGYRIGIKNHDKIKLQQVYNHIRDIMER